MKKASITLFSVLAVSLGYADASTSFIDFANSNGTVANAYLIEATGNSSGSGSLLDFNTGLGAGLSVSYSITNMGPSGAGAHNGVTLPADIAAVFDESTGAVYKDSLGSHSGTADYSSTLTFSNLQANTTYTFSLLSSRSINNDYIHPGTYSLAETAFMTDYSFSLTGGSGGTATSNGYSNLVTNSNQTAMITWTFTTGAIVDPTDTVVFQSTAGALNAMRIDAVANPVPEPTTASLSLLALTSLLVRRRRA